MNYEEEQISKEVENMKQMTPFQKEVAMALKELHFKYKYNKTYQLNDASMSVDIGSIKNVKDLFNVAFKNGAQEKVWEIQRVLQVI